MKKDEMILYWIESSEKDYQVMMDLFEKGHYTWSLFIGHLVIEKLLKAIYLRRTGNNPPLIHDLYRFSERCQIDLTEEQKDFLDTITTFNISSRYGDYNREFCKKCTKTFTGQWIHCIDELIKCLKIYYLNQF